MQNLEMGTLPFMAGGILFIALLFYGLRLWARFHLQNKRRKDSLGLVQNPGMYRILAVLGILFFCFLMGLVIYDVIAKVLHPETSP